MESKIKGLNLGCEKEYRESNDSINWINLDFDKRYKADVRYDLRKFPWKFKDNEFDMILASGIIEHLTDISKVFMEMYRVSKHGGLIYIMVPHASEILNSWGDLEHKRPFLYCSFGEWWANKDLYPYFEVIKRKISFTRLNFKFMNFLNPIINLFPKIYERLFSGILPSGVVVFILKVRKDKEFQEKQRKYIDKMEEKQLIDNLKFIKEI